MKIEMPPLTAFTSSSGGKKYRYYKCSFGKIGGKLMSYKNADRAKVAVWRAEKAQDLKELGLLATEFSAESKLDAVLALRKLPPGVTLEQAVDAYLEFKGPVDIVMVFEAGYSYIHARDEDFNQGEIREPTLKEIRVKVGKFMEKFGQFAMSDLTKDDILAWLTGSAGLAPNSVYQYINVISTFLKWCVQQGSLKENPLAGIKRPKRTRHNGDAPFLSVPDTRTLLEFARREEPAMVPYFALGLFAGLRPEETRRLKWGDIDMDTGVIRVRASVSKTQDARVVTMSPNLIHILAGEYGRLVKTRAPLQLKAVAGLTVHFSRGKFDRIKRESRIEWADSILRHTFATYHLAGFSDASATSYELGHRSQDMLYRHYRGMATEAEATKFWGITLGL